MKASDVFKIKDDNDDDERMLREQVSDDRAVYKSPEKHHMARNINQLFRTTYWTIHRIQISPKDILIGHLIHPRHSPCIKRFKPFRWVVAYASCEEKANEQFIVALKGSTSNLCSWLGIKRHTARNWLQGAGRVCVKHVLQNKRLCCLNVKGCWLE